MWSGFLNQSLTQRLNYHKWFSSARLLPFPASGDPRVNAPSGLRMAEKVEMVLRGERNLHSLSHSILHATPSMITSVTFCNFAQMNK